MTSFLAGASPSALHFSKSGSAAGKKYTLSQYSLLCNDAAMHLPKHCSFEDACWDAVV